MQTSFTNEPHSRACSEQRICRHLGSRALVGIFRHKRTNSKYVAQRELHRSVQPASVPCYHRGGQHSVDLSQLSPELQHQWHGEKNSDFGGSVVNPFSFRIAAWKCPNCQHEWQTKVLDRAVSATDCPQCLHSKKLSMMCDDDEYPFASQWNYLRNDRKDVLPGDIEAGSLQPVWWQCTKCPQKWPHEWQASPVSRLSESFQCCPYCSNIRPCICNDVPRV